MDGNGTRITDAQRTGRWPVSVDELAILGSQCIPSSVFGADPTNEKQTRNLGCKAAASSFQQSGPPNLNGSTARDEPGWRFRASLAAELGAGFRSRLLERCCLSPKFRIPALQREQTSMFNGARRAGNMENGGTGTEGWANAGHPCSHESNRNYRNSVAPNGQPSQSGKRKQTSRSQISISKPIIQRGRATRVAPQPQ